MLLMVLLASIITAFGLFEVLALRYGVDSRPGFDERPAACPSPQPLIAAARASRCASSSAVRLRPHGDLRQGGLRRGRRRHDAARGALRARRGRLLGDRRRAPRDPAAPAAPAPRASSLAALALGADRLRVQAGLLLLRAATHRRVADVAAALHVPRARLLRRGRARPRARRRRGRRWRSCSPPPAPRSCCSAAAAAASRRPACSSALGAAVDLRGLHPRRRRRRRAHRRLAAERARRDRRGGRRSSLAGAVDRRARARARAPAAGSGSSRSRCSRTVVPISTFLLGLQRVGAADRVDRLDGRAGRHRLAGDRAARRDARPGAGRSAAALVLGAVLALQSRRAGRER